MEGKAKAGEIVEMELMMNSKLGGGQATGSLYGGPWCGEPPGLGVSLSALRGPHPMRLEVRRSTCCWAERPASQWLVRVG